MRPSIWVRAEPALQRSTGDARDPVKPVGVIPSRRQAPDFNEVARRAIDLGNGFQAIQVGALKRG